jgi:hypothetical protein
VSNITTQRLQSPRRATDLEQNASRLENSLSCKSFLLNQKNSEIEFVPTEFLSGSLAFICRTIILLTNDGNTSPLEVFGLSL